MARINANELRNGMKVNSSFILKNKKLLPFKGKPGNYLNLVLGDSTGQVEAKIWEKAEEADLQMKPGDILMIKGEAREFNGLIQLNVTSFYVCTGEGFDPRDFLPYTPYDTEVMLAELTGLMDSVVNPYLKTLLNSLFRDKTWLDRFILAPAAKANHQAYLGGLLEHTLNVARLAASIAGVYRGLDRDLLLTGAILHDIGKIEEYRYDRVIDFSDEGRLLGHIVIGAGELDRRIRSLNPEAGPFPEDLRLKILHIITSHHGHYEWQSPKRPKFAEAEAIHVMDLLDSHLDSFFKAAGERVDEDSWSSWIKSLERYVYLK